jgi:hypothetical protein
MILQDVRSQMAQDINRIDKEYLYIPWINQALRSIQTEESWECMRTRNTPQAPLVMQAGSSTVSLPSNFKELTSEQYPISVRDANATSVLAELPCEVISREKLVTYRSSAYIPPIPANLRGRLDGLPVWVELVNGGWTLNVLDVAAQNISFIVSYYGFLPELAVDNDTNWFLNNYPELVMNKIKAIAFAAINDPIAATFEKLWRAQIQSAKADDSRRKNRGRVFRMGG